jgi:hypothetical protein
MRADPDAANWDITALDTATDIDYLTAIEKDVVLEMNQPTPPQSSNRRFGGVWLVLIGMDFMRV